MSHPMMPLAIDPSERRAPAREAKAPAPGRAGRPILLAGLGCVGVVGLSVIANAMLSGLAAPPPTKIILSRAAADMPDLRDGVPALVSGGNPLPASLPPASSREAMAIPASLPPVPAPVSAPDAGAAQAVAAVAPAAKPADRPARVPPVERVLPIENAALVIPVRPAVLVAVSRNAILVPPSARETIRAHPAPAVSTSFAALPPEPAPRETAVTRKKPAPAAIARAKPAAATHAATTHAATAEVATATEAVPASAAPDAEETEVFGLKVPSLAPAGRKLVEGVQAIGDAVRDLPGKF